VIIPLDLIIFLVLIVTAVLALSTKDLLAAVALLAAYSLFAAILFAGVAAVDVALVEAALGAGLTGILFIAAIMTTTRRSNPRLEVRRRYVVTPLIVAVLALLLYASTGLPDRGDPDAPAQQGISVEYLTRSRAETNTPNVVTALLADFRSMDTLGETLVIVTASLSAALVLVRRTREEDEDEGLPEGAGDLTASDPGEATPDGEGGP
jgi:multicomponent Na+:H+ antiporter subunit B